MAKRRNPASADPIDDIDLALLHALSEDARAPMGMLSDAAGVSRATAYARLARLREEGVINAFTITVDPERVGLTVTAVVLMRYTPDNWMRWSSLAPVFQEMDEVEYAADLAGEFDILLLVRLRDAQHLQRFLAEELRSRVPGIGSVRTMLVLQQTPESSLVLPPK